jgi:hypothetical protein
MPWKAVRTVAGASLVLVSLSVPLIALAQEWRDRATAQDDEQCELPDPPLRCIYSWDGVVGQSGVLGSTHSYKELQQLEQLKTNEIFK